METWQGKHFSITDPKGVSTVIYQIYKTKKEFLKKWRNDYSFRRDMRMHGVRVIQDNVIFLNGKGSIESVAGAYVK